MEDDLLEPFWKLLAILSSSRQPKVRGIIFGTVADAVMDHWKLVILLVSIPGLLILLQSPSALTDQINWFLWLTLTALIFTVFDPTGLINPIGLTVLILAVTSLVLTVRFVKRKRLTGRLIGRQARARRHRWAIKERE